jgi:hypothetical protein
VGPGCVDACKALERGFDNASLYGREASELNEDARKELIRSRFSSVLEMGLFRDDSSTLEVSMVDTAEPDDSMMSEDAQLDKAVTSLLED